MYCLMMSAQLTRLRDEVKALRIDDPLSAADRTTLTAHSDGLRSTMSRHDAPRHGAPGTARPADLLAEARSQLFDHWSHSAGVQTSPSHAMHASHLIAQIEEQLQLVRRDAELSRRRMFDL